MFILAAYEIHEFNHEQLRNKILRFPTLSPAEEVLPEDGDM
jgi:hypothetical protein